MLSEVFWNSFVITVSGVLLAVVAACYKSKCRTIRCCGLEIDRDTDAEEQIDEIEMENRRTESKV